jgi:hypothetical protein
MGGLNQSREPVAGLFIKKKKGLFMTMRRSGLYLSLLTLMAAAFLGTGCVTNGRRVLLREYGPTVPELAGEPLKGVTICLKGFNEATNLASLEPKTKPEEPSPFKYVNFTKEQETRWTDEMRSLQAQIAHAEYREIGDMRNEYGMVMSHVYALNDPAAWLAESLKFDLEAQGAKVVDASQAASADVSVSGNILFCHLAMYMTIGGNLVVDLDVQPKQGGIRRRQIYTHGGTLAVLASEGEYYHALREARQKFSILAEREIAQALKP